MSFTHRAFHEATMFVQELASHDKNADYTPMAREIGQCAPMACSTAEDFETLIHSLSGTLQTAFVRGAHHAFQQTREQHHPMLVSFVSRQAAALV